MKSNTGSFFAALCYAFRKWRNDGEIFGSIFPHLRREGDYGYPFSSDEEMVSQTEGFRLQEQLDALEKQMQQLPDSYGKSFRYIMHRDLAERLDTYTRLAQRHAPREIDPRYVATRA